MKSLLSLQHLNFKIDVKSTLKYVYDAITLTRHKLDGKVPLIGFAGAPVSFSFLPLSTFFLFNIKVTVTVYLNDT